MSFKRIKGILKLLSKKAYKKIAVLDERKFTRNRKIKKYKGYIVLSVDGSLLELPNSEELKESKSYIKVKKSLLYVIDFILEYHLYIN